MYRPKIIGISGLSGSGKTTFTKSLEAHFEDKSISLSMDNFYKPVSQHPLECGFRNHEVLDSFDLDKLKKVLRNLKSGKNQTTPLYNKQTGLSDEFLELKPKQIIFIEGILFFNEPEIYDLIDLSFWLKVDLKTQELRLKTRSKDFNPAYYKKIIKPSQKLFYKSAYKKADHTFDIKDINIQEIIQFICLK